jgi:hypothetical protein
MHECPHDGTIAFGLSACYFHLRERLRRGGSLTEDEYDFIGLLERSSTNGGGRRSANDLEMVGLDYSLSAEDAALMQALMRIGSEGQLDFLA